MYIRIWATTSTATEAKLCFHPFLVSVVEALRSFTEEFQKVEFFVGQDFMGDAGAVTPDDLFSFSQLPRQMTRLRVRVC